MSYFPLNWTSHFEEAELPDTAISVAAILQQRLLSYPTGGHWRSTIRSVKKQPLLYQEIFLSISLERNKDKITPKVPIILQMLQVSLDSLMNVPCVCKFCLFLLNIHSGHYSKPSRLPSQSLNTWMLFQRYKFALSGGTTLAQAIVVQYLEKV